MTPQPSFDTWDQAWRAFAGACKGRALGELLPGGFALDAQGHVFALDPNDGRVQGRADEGHSAHHALRVHQETAKARGAAGTLRALLAAHTDPGLLLSISMLGGATRGRQRLRLQPCWIAPGTSPWAGFVHTAITPDITVKLWSTPTELARLCTTLARQHHKTPAPATQTLLVETGWQGGTTHELVAHPAGLWACTRTLPGCKADIFAHEGGFGRSVCGAYPLAAVPEALAHSWGCMRTALEDLGPTSNPLMWAKDLEKAAILFSHKLTKPQRAKLDALWKTHLTELARATGRTEPERWMFTWHHAPNGTQDARWTYATPGVPKLVFSQMDDAMIVPFVVEASKRPWSNLKKPRPFLVETTKGQRLGLALEMSAVPGAKTAQEAAAIAWRVGWTQQTAGGVLDVWRRPHG